MGLILIVVLICIYLISDAKRLFIYMLVICVSFFRKMSIQNPFPLFNQIYLSVCVCVFCPWTMMPSYILDFSPLQIYDLQIFLPILQDAFSFCWWLLFVQYIFNLI